MILLKIFARRWKSRKAARARLGNDLQLGEDPVYDAIAPGEVESIDMFFHIPFQMVL